MSKETIELDAAKARATRIRSLVKDIQSKRRLLDEITISGAIDQPYIKDLQLDIDKCLCLIEREAIAIGG